MNRWIAKKIRFPALGLIPALWAVAASAQSATNYSFTFPVNEAVPDGNPSGLALTTNLTGMSGTISNVTVSLDITGGYNGDLYVHLDGPNGGFAVLLNRAGVTGGDAFGYSDTGFNVTFDDSAGYNNIHFYQNSGYTLNGGGQLTGMWSSDGRAIDPLSASSTFAVTQPTSLLDSFDGTNPNGTWKLFLSDLSNGEQSTLVNWRLDIEAVPEPSACALFGIGTGILLAARFGVCTINRKAAGRDTFWGPGFRSTTRRFPGPSHRQTIRFLSLKSSYSLELAANSEQGNLEFVRNQFMLRASSLAESLEPRATRRAVPKPAP